MTKNKNFLSRNKLSIGFAIELTVSEMIRKDLVIDTEVSDFEKQCVQFLVAAAKKFFERSPLGSMIVKHTRCLDPKHFDSNNALETTTEAFNI